MIGDDSKSSVVRPHCHVHKHARAHTHTHICTCLHNMFTPTHNTLKNEILSSPMGVGVGKHKINPQYRKIDRRKEKNNFFSALTVMFTQHEKCRYRLVGYFYFLGSIWANLIVERELGIIFGKFNIYILLKHFVG